MVWLLDLGLSTVFAWSMNNMRLSRYPNTVRAHDLDQRPFLLLAGGIKDNLERIESK